MEFGLPDRGDTAAQSDEAVPESEHDTAMRRLTDRIEKVADLVSNLEHRLEPVLSPHATVEAMVREGDVPREAVAPVVADLDVRTTRVAYIEDRLIELRSRLVI